jgi:glucosamine kinase
MTNETLLLGLDAGASSTKWAILSPRLEVLASGRSAPLTGHIFTPEQRAENFAALETLVLALSEFKPTHAVAGITGLSIGSEAAQFYQQALLEGLGLTDVSVMSDMDLAYLAHFEPGEGILVYAGTGGIAYHLKTDGGVVRAGGRGYLISDPGGGFSIGQKALEFVTTLMDVSDTPETYPLARAIFWEIGNSSDWAVLREHVYKGGRQAVAAFAPIVGQVAANGDSDARHILELAGAEIAMLASRMMRRVGILPIALAGGALQVSPILEQSARAKLGNLDVRVPILDLAVEAAKLALEV